MVFREAKLVIKNKNQTLFQNNKNNNRKKEVETGASFHQFKAAGLVVVFDHNAATFYRVKHHQGRDFLMKSGQEGVHTMLVVASGDLAKLKINNV